MIIHAARDGYANTRSSVDRRGIKEELHGKNGAEERRLSKGQKGTKRKEDSVESNNRGDKRCVRGNRAVDDDPRPSPSR
jgi:hypothetical protein